MCFYFFNFKISVRALSKKLKEFSKLVDQLLVQDMEREALHIHLDVLRVEIHTAKNQLAEEKEQIVMLKVKEIAFSLLIFDVILHVFCFKDEKDEADRMAEEAKLRTKRAQEDVYRCLRIRVKEELTAEVRALFDLLPNTIPEIDEAIGNATARIQLMGRADEQVFIVVNISSVSNYISFYVFINQIVRDYAEREILIEQLAKKINNINNRATSMKDKMYSWYIFTFFGVE